jgi:hypothetical protein
MSWELLEDGLPVRRAVIEFVRQGETRPALSNLLDTVWSTGLNFEESGEELTFQGETSPLPLVAALPVKEALTVPRKIREKLLPLNLLTKRIDLSEAFQLVVRKRRMVRGPLVLAECDGRELTVEPGELLVASCDLFGSSSDIVTVVGT